MIILQATTETLELITSSALSIDVLISYADLSTTAFTPGAQASPITTAATTTILAAPAASVQRQVKFLTICNKGTGTQTITLQKAVSGVKTVLFNLIALKPNEVMQYADGQGMSVLDPFARPKVVSSATIANPPDPATPYFVSEPDIRALIQGLRAEQRLTNMIMQSNFGTDFDFDQVINELLNTQT